MRKILLFLTAMIVTCVNSVFAQLDKMETAPLYEIKEDVLLVPCRNEDRQEGVKKLFKKMGAKDEDLKVEKMKDIENLTILKKGKSDETVIIGAHYDKVTGGCGAIDNWTGIVIIAHIYNTIKDLETEKSYLFVAFDKEEPGLLGSAAMVKTIPKEKRNNFCSMINLDSFGFEYPQVMENTSSDKMTKIAIDLARELKMPFNHLKLANADADSSSFKDKDIPAITFHGMSSSWKSFLHSSNDKVENINFSSVHVGYKFALRYLTKVDAEKCSAFKN